MAFNQDIGGWDVSNVTDMQAMFAYADSFNQDISDWDVSNVTNFDWMFYGAQSFNQSLAWLDMPGMTGNPGGIMAWTSMSALNVDGTLAGWVAQTPPSNLSLYLGTLPYGWCNGEAWCNLVNNNFYTEGSGSVAVAALQAAGWTVTGGNLISTTNSLTPQITETMDSGATRSFSFRLKNGSGRRVHGESAFGVGGDADVGGGVSGCGHL
jgi:surface protein